MSNDSQLFQTQHFTDESRASEQSYQLTQLEVYNWGPFSGLHRADFDRDGTAIIGPTGSGKTTLVDALMTLLVQQPRYNLASTGGHESDRSLISYVRGVLGGDGSDGREEIARPGKTLTGICATYQRHEETVKLGGLLRVDGSGNSAQDLKKFWIFSRAEEQSLEHWLRLLYEEGAKSLKKVGRETAGLRIFDTKASYLAHTRKFFDVSENAFTLLNRAAGLKQLNSIDEIFRDLVLDDHSVFDRALEVAKEFDNLAEIHAELELARKQRDTLVPVEKSFRILNKANDKLEKHENLKRILPIWFAMTAEQLWGQELEALAKDKSEIELVVEQERETEKECEGRVDTLRQRFLELGGNVIESLKQTIEAQAKLVKEREKNANDYRRMVSAFGLDDALTAVTFKQNQETLLLRRAETQRERDVKYDETLSIRSQQLDLETRAKEIESTIQRVKQRPGSNIPPSLQDFRTELANELGLQDGDLPFLAELVEVKQHQGAWRGAIERALGSERLRILVPEPQLKAALHWVNHRDNRVHVRLQGEFKIDRPREFFQDGYSQKLNFKNHAILSVAKHLIASRDLHCVDSSSQLRTTEYALTVEGMMSGKNAKFEKQDQRRLHENWMTGFDNREQLHSFGEELKEIHRAIEELRPEAKSHQSQLSLLDGRINFADHLLDLESEHRLQSLLDPNSDAARAKNEYDVENAKLRQLKDKIKKHENHFAKLEFQYAEAETKRNEANERIGSGLTTDELAFAKSEMPIHSEVNAKKVDSVERTTAKSVDDALDKQRREVGECERQLIHLMEAAKRTDTGALADVGADLQDIDDYLERLRVLNEEALPEKRERFREYLKRSSGQGVTQLLASINEEVDAIKQRLGELNQTLVKVDFRSGRYLQLKPQGIKHERLRSLETSMRKLRSSVLQNDQGEAHFQALQELVQILRDAGENRRREGSRALLDPRFRLQFFVVEVDRQTGDSSPPRTGSQSGSGGEKELMASHILTASLSYALCPTEATYPLYGTVILDEAFSKSSPSAASRIIEALRIFRLHPIFVTPNKEIGLLKQHTRKVICVQRPKKEASLASISWEILEEFANPYNEQRLNEIT